MKQKIIVTPSLTKDTTVKEVINHELGKRTSFIFESDDCIDVADEYHSMHDLYEHRMALNIALFHTLDELYNRNGLSMFVPKVYKSKNHHPTSDLMFEGYFIVFAVDNNGVWTSYHYKLKHWNKFKIRIAEFSPPYPLYHIDSIEFFSNLCWRDE